VFALFCAADTEAMEAVAVTVRPDGLDSNATCLQANRLTAGRLHLPPPELVSSSAARSHALCTALALTVDANATWNTLAPPARLVS